VEQSNGRQPGGTRLRALGNCFVEAVAEPQAHEGRIFFGLDNWSHNRLLSKIVSFPVGFEGIGQGSMLSNARPMEGGPDTVDRIFLRNQRQLKTGVQGGLVRSSARACLS
jgi:hypothetical protein